MRDMGRAVSHQQDMAGPRFLRPAYALRTALTKLPHESEIAA